jgi:hypothetical protein
MMFLSKIGAKFENLRLQEIYSVFSSLRIQYKFYAYYLFA